MRPKITPEQHQLEYCIATLKQSEAQLLEVLPGARYCHESLRRGIAVLKQEIERLSVEAADSQFVKHGSVFNDRK